MNMLKDRQAVGHRICDDRIADFITVDLFNKDSLKIVNAISPDKVKLSVSD